MNYDDFFLDTEKGNTIFDQDKPTLSLARDTFDELKEVSRFFAV